MSCVVKPFVPLGTRKPRVPSSVAAHTTATSAIEPFVIHIFCPCSDPVAAVAARACAHRAGVRAGVGLGQAEAADRLAGGHARQPLGLLLLRAPAPDRVHRQRPLHGHQRAQPAVAGLELQAREPVRGRGRAGAAVAGEVHAEHAELAELRRELARREARLLEPVADVREHAVAHERAHGVADVALLVGEQAIDVEEVLGTERGGRGCGARHGLTLHLGGEPLVHRAHGARALADSGGDALHRAAAHVARGEHAGRGGLERQRIGRAGVYG